MIGERLAEIRKDKGDTQETFAEKLHVSKFTVSSWEQEKSEPSHTMLVQICRLYQISSDYLLGLTNIDPSYMRQKASTLDEDDQKLMKDMEEFLLWRNKKNK